MERQIVGRPDLEPLDVAALKKSLGPGYRLGWWVHLQSGPG